MGRGRRNEETRRGVGSRGGGEEEEEMEKEGKEGRRRVEEEVEVRRGGCRWKRGEGRRG